jgi:transposase
MHTCADLRRIGTLRRRYTPATYARSSECNPECNPLDLRTPNESGVSDVREWGIAPLLLQVKHNHSHPGRPRLDDRRVLNGILFVLYTGIRWEFLPQEPGYGSGMTCWRRLRDWNEAGVWQRLHEALLAELRGAGMLDFSRVAVDGSHVRAMKGGTDTGPSPVDRGRSGSKHHVIVEAHASRWPLP